jgi:hypothetical protein
MVKKLNIHFILLVLRLKHRISTVYCTYRVQRKFAFSRFREHSIEISAEIAGEIKKKKNWKMRRLDL